MAQITGKARKLARELLRKNRHGASWRVIAHEVYADQINYATLNRFAKSKGTWIPKDDSILIVLELKKPHVPKPKPIKKKIAAMARQTRLDLGLQK